jgi:dihydroneopterin aldolase
MTAINHNVHIDIKGLEVKTVIGVFPEEKQMPQTLILDVKIKLDSSRAAKSDDLDDTIDYFRLTELIRDKVQFAHFNLLEKMMDFILKIIMKDSLIEEVEVTIHKPEALKRFGAVVSITSSAKR